jgi:hypothetical protein
MSHITGWQDAFRDSWVHGYNRFPLPPVIELGEIENERIGVLSLGKYARKPYPKSPGGKRLRRGYVAIAP